MYAWVWTIQLPMTKTDVIKELKGNQVAFEDCFVSPLPFLLSFPFSTVPETPGYLPITSPAGSPLMSVSSTCIPSFAVLVSDMETFQTNDSFHTWTRVRVDPKILSDSERHSVSSVTLAGQGIFFLINGAVYLMSVNQLKKLQGDHGIPDNGIVGIKSRRWCGINTFFKNQKNRSTMAAWTNSEVYLGYASLKFARITTSAELKSFLNLPPSDILTIENLEYTVHPLELTVLLYHVCAACVDKKVYILIYNEQSSQWVTQDFELEISLDTFLVSRSLFSAMPDLVLWDKHRVYYCYQNFTLTGTIQTSTGEENLSVLSSGSNIHDVYVDYYGNIIVKMENNVMFYFKINIRDAVKLHFWMSETTKSLFFFSDSYHAYLVYVFDNGTVQPQDYPLNLEVQSVTYKSQDKCPYMAFHNNVFRVIYFLDKGENLSIWSQIVYPENTGLHTIVETYGPKVLAIAQDSHYEIALGYCTKTLSVTFTQIAQYELKPDYFKQQQKDSGLLVVQLRPSEYSKTCPIAQKVFEIAVGCNSNKAIRVKGFSGTECKHRDFSYVIHRSYLRKEPLRNLKVRYDWGKYGCPLRVDFREKFQPVIQVSDENGVYGDVDVNFIVWEIHGRDDYTFNSTMKQSGCLNEAQTWKTMMEMNENLPLDMVWGPENYRPCFSYAIGKPGDLSQPYEILNISNKNHLVWPTDHVGMYVFRAKVLDPNFSFCNLTAIFAVETIGVIPKPNVYLVAAFLFILMLVFFTILVLSYFHYQRIYRQYIYEPLHKPQNKQKKN
uniref:Uncharacterized protein C1orf101 homolog n=1 Tax=Castor canadensis TaxID=51338 RepID=A0A8B7TWU7_CASCN|nr:uncharacterized protein C1orf101 homolog [Castor canadensis]